MCLLTLGNSVFAILLFVLGNCKYLHELPGENVSERHNVSRYGSCNVLNDMPVA